MKRKTLEVAVFICGAVVMIFELVGSRVLGPYFGTSIYVWTSLIGIITENINALKDSSMLKRLNDIASFTKAGQEHILFALDAMSGTKQKTEGFCLFRQ